MMKRKGLFGAIPMPGVIGGYGGGTWNMDGTQATPVDRGGFEVPTNGGPSLPEAAPTPKKGGGFFGEGGFGRYLAGSIGDVLMQANGFEPTFAPTMALRRQMELQQQRAQQQREYDWQDWQRKQEWERANPKPSTAQPYRWEDNAGNVWEYGQDGQPKRIFTDTVPKYYIQGDQALQIPNPYATQGASQNRPKIGETVRLDQLDPPSINNTPAPQTGANGFPATLTRDQYQAVVDQMGQVATDAWMARNNVRLGN